MTTNAMGPGGGAGEIRLGPGETPPFDTGVAHIARVDDYWLGGKENFAAIRMAEMRKMRQ